MTDTAARRLVVVRHAKTEQFATSDHKRELTARGRRDSEGIGRWLASQGIRPDVVLVSSAARAQETARLMCGELSSEPSVEVLDGLYTAGWDDALEHVHELDDTVACAAVVGHNPTMAALADVLSENGINSHFPTSAIAVLDFDGPWADLSEGQARLAYLHTPHDA